MRGWPRPPGLAPALRVGRVSTGSWCRSSRFSTTRSLRGRTEPSRTVSTSRRHLSTLSASLICARARFCRPTTPTTGDCSWQRRSDAQHTRHHVSTRQYSHQHTVRRPQVWLLGWHQHTQSIGCRLSALFCRVPTRTTREAQFAFDGGRLVGPRQGSQPRMSPWRQPFTRLAWSDYKPLNSRFFWV